MNSSKNHLMCGLRGGSLCVPAVLGLTLLASMPVQAEIKCWTNNEGVRECGTSVPPEFAQKGHETIKDGIVVEETERAKTPEELEEAARLAAEKAEQDRIIAEAKRQDKILLDTFSNTEDIDRVRDEQIAALEATIKVTETRNEKIQQDLEKRIAAAAAEERDGKTPNEDLLKDIESLRRQVETNEEFMKEKRADQDRIRQEYADKTARFLELRGGH